MALIEFVNEYCSNKIPCHFRYAGFYDEKYKDNYGMIQTVKAKMDRVTANQLVNFTLDDQDVRSKNRSVSVEFNVSRPIVLTVLLPVAAMFSFQEFASAVSPLFTITYGFSYIVDNYSWPTAYAFGDWQHVKGTLSVDRLAKTDLQRWSANCENISAGFLRYVYHENLLRTKQLMKKVGDSPLETFIRDHSAGMLESLGADLFSWVLNDQELKFAREVLKKSSLFI